ncbi:MAG: PQQ-binding-like beta-propeller repeat protein, partial [Planctomycetaceae bacterium]
ASGDVLWKQTAVTATPHQGTHSTNNFASASPCTDGTHVYAHFGSRGLFCYTMNGELKWSRTDFPKMSTRNSFGEGSSPTITGNLVLLPWDHEGDSFLYALDKLTGKTVWQTARDEPTEWSTPLVVDAKGGQQVILNGQNYARGYDLKTGKELWRCSGQTDRPVASAVSMGDLAIVGSGFRGSYMAAFRLDGRGDLRGTRSVVWQVNRDTPDIASPLLTNGRVYFHKAKTGVLTCLNAATGEECFGASRIPGIATTYASPVAAGGFIFLTGRSGTIVVIKDSAELEIVSTNELGEGIDATPAPVDDQLFIRGTRHLYCISAR